MRILFMAVCLMASGCPNEDSRSWQIVHEDLDAALLSVWGTSASDVWAVGGDVGDGMGPLVIHFDGTSWERMDTGHTGELWWVYGFAGGPVYMGGAGGAILRYQDGSFSEMSTPGNQTVFGIWGASPSDVWAVGGEYGGARGAFDWRLQGDAWVAAEGFPDLVDSAAIWKLFGRGPNDVWLVGTNGTVIRWDGQTFMETDTGVGESLFTVHANAERFAAVGGFGGGLLLELEEDTWTDRSPTGADGLVGVCLTEGEGGYAVGWYGGVFEREGGSWKVQDKGFYIDQTLHSVWVDPTGGVWAVGGDVLTFPLVRGVMLHWGDAVPEGGLQ